MDADALIVVKGLVAETLLLEKVTLADVVDQGTDVGGYDVLP